MAIGERDELEKLDDEVTEAGIESFPASDPPAYNTPGRRKSRIGQRDGPRGTDKLREQGATLRSVPTGPKKSASPGRRAKGKRTARRKGEAASLHGGDATGGAAQESAIKQAMARENVRLLKPQRRSPLAPAAPRVSRSPYILVAAGTIAVVVVLLMVFG